MTTAKRKKTTTPTISALAPFFGGNRMLGPTVGKALEGCQWVGIPFMGGGPELAHITARTIVANDLHRAVINMARVIADPVYGPKLYRESRRLTIHPDTLSAAQQRCRQHLAASQSSNFDPSWALDYFVCCWMGRNGLAGTDGELSGGLSFRWESGGGDSVVRFRNAAAGLRDWRRVLSKVTFDGRDAFEFLDKCKDQAGHGIYCDPPWPSDGDNYRHKFTEADQRCLAARLSEYRETRVVIRFGDHPLIRELYPVDRWHWIEQTGRTAANKGKAEVLILNQRPEDAR